MLTVWYAFVGVRPSDGSHWLSIAKKFFAEHVEDKTFIVYVKPQQDAMKASSASEDCWAVMLVESLPDKTYRYVHSDIASKCSGIQRVDMKGCWIGCDVLLLTLPVIWSTWIVLAYNLRAVDVQISLRLFWFENLLSGLVLIYVIRSAVFMFVTLIILCRFLLHVGLCVLCIVGMYHT